MSLNSSTSPIGTIILFLSLSLFYLPKLFDAYNPVDRFSINCGSSGKSFDGDRTWRGDINSKLLSLENKPTVVAQASTQSPSTSQVPYTTARLSYSEFSYSFPVTEGPKFVRLFFYPSSYFNFDRPNTFFTVKSGRFTLLKDFNASLTADADVEQSDTIFREYIINVEDGQWLNLTFTPNTSHPNSYAFVNGIEVVSMPTNLYYTASTDQGFKLVGSNYLYSIRNSTALETDYRLRIGGKTITPKGDTGLLRRWDGNDFDYLITPKGDTGLPVDYSGTSLSFTIIPNYTAPDELYRTERDMGRNGTLNKISNLTWEFTLDTGFFYMLRLHFCELDPNIKRSSDRAFFIYIAEQMAEDHADVLKWSKQKGVPVYRDYAVFVTGNQKKTNLSLQMHPLPDRDTSFSDPFLNGLEIFKISDANNLAGPNPNPVQNTPPNSSKLAQKSKNDSGTTIIGVVARVGSGVVLLSIFAVFVLRHKRNSLYIF